MKTLRENMIPVAILTLWMAASAYTIDALGKMHGPRVEATMDVSVTGPMHAAARESCPSTATTAAALHQAPPT
jgi:hypothetical protein